MPATRLTLSQEACDVFSRGRKHSNCNGIVLAYGLENVTTAMVQKLCDEATESYAKEVLNWTGDESDKPKTFTPVNDGPFQTLNECTEHLVRHLQGSFEPSPPRSLPTYSHGYVAFSRKNQSTIATLVLPYWARGPWRISHRPIPIHTELGMTVESLRMGDAFERDVLVQYPPACPEDESSSEESDPGPEIKWAFAIFSTGLTSALRVVGMIDPWTTEDDHQPSAATVDLLADPKTSRKLFICCDNDQPAAKGALVMQMEWDSNIAREQTDLQDIGATTTIHKERVQIGAALAKAYEMVQDLD
ncbi:hypothetical protein N7492_008910 [Penicillium capsulatum]|uniref:Uncharacterized protein n=1 Tax=Penicillium capsulatum TaxID=69766 RepID=A0A9W9HS73_9EURO|nr:hypothetical protein N7492_008910 [Penicillium capsulatum]KAJ6106310.1 hypothetical protein N7512_009827 [Penicillium capsulatum]